MDHVQKRTNYKKHGRITNTGHQIPNKSQYPKPNYPNGYFDLEDRTYNFAKNVMLVCKSLPKSIVATPLISQLIRSAGSVGANYIEANDFLGKKDCIHRMKISRKECKETEYWLKLLLNSNTALSKELQPHLSEARELRNILSSTINKLCQLYFL